MLAASTLTFTGIAPGVADAQNIADRSAADPSVMRVVLPDDEAEDAAITANVKNAIAACVGSGAPRINVETRVAIVTLSGEAASNEIRDRAHAAALIVSGVRDVIDRIRVTSTA
jgi:osmotically-inducible protein OsmY